MDNIFNGNAARRWHEDIGPYGDKPRMALLNHVLIHVLSHIAASPLQERANGSKSHLREALESLGRPDKLGIPQTEESLLVWHADDGAIKGVYPDLEGAHLWDIGCGNGYMGAWLCGLGVNYRGVEPSADLIAIGKSDSRLLGASLDQSNMVDFCNGAVAANDHAPTMISIVAVLEHIRDPEESLRALAKLLYDREWHDVPVFVATLDPDFLLRGLPRQAVTVPPSMAYGDPDLVSLRDPAHWEELFTRTGFWILEQRPVHLGALTEWLARDFLEQFEALHPGSGAKVPPRQAPFYFWLLSRARGRIREEAEIDPEVEPVNGVATKILEFSKGELITPMGNLGASTNLVTEGRVSYHSDTLHLDMEFRDGEYFGQLELSGNYISSRVLGIIKAEETTRLLNCASSDLNRSVEASRKFSDKLFQSLLLHLDATRFAGLVTPQRMSKDVSRVLGTFFPENWVRNYAGSLLQACSDAAAVKGPRGYRARLIVEFGPQELSETIYGRQKRAQDGHAIIPSLVQSEVIDCFSSAILEKNKLLENVEGAEHPDANLLHIGWLAARYLVANDESWTLGDEQVPSPDEHPALDRLQELAIAISAMLSHEDDKASYCDIRESHADAERRDIEDKGKRARRVQPRTGPKEIRTFICEQLLLDTTGRTQLFLQDLGQFFTFKPKDHYETERGLSDLVVVRDIWALLACVSDDSNIWSHAMGQVKVRDYPCARQRERIIAYLQECMTYIGERAGFSLSPW